MAMAKQLCCIRRRRTAGRDRDREREMRNRYSLFMYFFLLYDWEGYWMENAVDMCDSFA